MTDRRPIQYAAGSLAVSAFVAVTQILTGATLDQLLYVALILIALNLPFQAMLFLLPVPPSSTQALSRSQMIYWAAIHRYSTIAIMCGFLANFRHFAWWLGVLFVIVVCALPATTKHVIFSGVPAFLI